MKLSNAVKFAVPAVVGILTLGLLTPSASASTTVTTTFGVSANVQALCTISAGALAFNTYTGAQAQATSNITVQCTNTTPYTVGLNQGTTATATVTNRLLAGPNSATLAYSLFYDSAYSKNWGNTTGSNQAGTGNGAAQTLTVYGQINAGQWVTPGSYTDTVTASVVY